ncbi:unnamed protein product [Blepharisma stoltei]|uniref:Ubiquitin-like domain-containing protein n=1 Tax=Blepharisma stoltei TaxID=1481888 RepID=A0AAU9JQM4_9CILI|nr:unnamed protein product [Blepharisma stoltei]
MKIQILIKNLEGVIGAVECEDAETIEVLKERISRSQGVQISQFTLFFGGRPLDLKTTISANRIVKDSTIAMKKVETEEESNGFSYSKTWPRGILGALKSFNKASDPNEIWERVGLELTRLVIGNHSFKWNLDKMCVSYMGINKEMDDLDEQWHMDTSYFGVEQRKSVFDIFKWNYIFLEERGETEEGLGKKYDDTELSRSYELILRDYRSPKTFVVLDKNPSLKLNDDSNDNFVFDTLSWDKVEKGRTQQLSKNQQTLRMKKSTKDMSGRVELNEDIERYKNQALNLKNGYFNDVLDFGRGLKERTKVIKSLKIKGEFAFKPFFTKLHKDYINQIDHNLDLFKGIFDGFKMCAGINCLKLKLSHSNESEQAENVLKMLQEIAVNDNLKYNLKYLDLSKTLISTEILNALLTVIRDSTIEHLALNNCIFENNGLDILSNSFSESAIVSIELRNNNIDDEFLKKLLHKFENCRYLKRLDISHNPIGAKCEESIKNLIRKTGITSLNISHTHIVQKELNAILNCAGCSQLEYICIEGNSKKDILQNYSTLGKILCCDFCRFWPKLGDSGCCLAIQNCFAIKAHQRVEADGDQEQKSRDINKKAENVQKKRQLDRNLDQLLEEKIRKMKEKLTIQAKIGSEDYEREKKRLEEEERNKEEEKKHELRVSEVGAAKIQSTIITTSNSTNNNTMDTRNNLQDVASPKAIENAPQEPEKKTAPIKSDPADIIDKVDGFVKNLEKME